MPSAPAQAKEAALEAELKEHGAIAAWHVLFAAQAGRAVRRRLQRWLLFVRDARDEERAAEAAARAHDARLLHLQVRYQCDVLQCNVIVNVNVNVNIM